MTEIKCVICSTFETNTTPVEAFFMGLMCCVSKTEQYNVSPNEVWDHAVSSLCTAHLEAYELPTKKTE